MFLQANNRVLIFRQYFLCMSQCVFVCPSVYRSLVCHRKSYISRISLYELKKDFKKIYNSLYDNRGKVRDDFSPKNKAIKAVAKNLKKAKDNILEYLPELKELSKDVKTGNLFGYIPSKPDKPIKIIIEQ